MFFLIYRGGGGETHPSALLIAMVALTVLGSGWTILGLLPMFAFPRTRRVAAALLATLASTSLVVFLLKLAVQRVRPCAALPNVRALFDAPTDFSFPSGHAAGAFAFAAFVGILVLRQGKNPARVGIVAGLFLLAAGIAASRIYLGCHFPGDVAGGAIVGLVVGGAGGRLERSER
jgi:undecaprenyl-diphosphatase